MSVQTNKDEVMKESRLDITTLYQRVKQLMIEVDQHYTKLENDQQKDKEIARLQSEVTKLKTRWQTEVPKLKARLKSEVAELKQQLVSIL